MSDVAQDLRAAEETSQCMIAHHKQFLMFCRAFQWEAAERERLIASASFEAHCDAMVRACMGLADGQ